MNRKANIFIICMGLMCSFALISCNKEKETNDIIINELMASNRTGLQKDNGDPTDWFELKNPGKDSLDLEGYTVVVTKEIAKDETDKPKKSKKKDKKNKAKTESKESGQDIEDEEKIDEKEDSSEKDEKESKTAKDETVKVKTWTFPSVKIGPNQCLVVFAEKYKDSEPGNSLQADLKLPKGGGTIQLLSPDEEVVSEVKYGSLEPDQSLALQSDGTYKPTYWQSPGFENTREGYEAAGKMIDSQRRDPLRIWELMSRAEHSYENWVELKNTGNEPINLSAYKLSKKIGKNEGWTIPEKTLAPGEIVTIQLVGSKAKPDTPTQAPFKIGDAETIVLTRDGNFVDGMNARLTPYGSSIGRQNGETGLFFFNTPTPNAENGKDGFKYIIDRPEWDQTPGIYKEKSEMVLRLKNPGRTVHYTLDGSEPTTDSPVFKDSILISKPTVVRSFAEGDSVTMRSNTATASYLVGVDHNLPVVSISLNPADFYDHKTGIYANGPGFGGDFPYQNANFWKNWTKRAHVELFDDNKVFTSDCGLKIFGGYSRALDKKSLRIKFRGQYGDSKVDYDFFETGEPQEFEDLVLRSGSQDWNRYMIKDEFFTSLVQSGSPTLLTQMYRPVAVYVNAEYFGLYYLREKIDKNFVARKLNLPNDSIDVYLSGASPYMDLVNKISNMDLTKPENFEFAKQNIDLQGLIDLKLGNIYSGKTDIGNIRHVRSLHHDSDKKWRYVFYDIDASWSAANKPSARFALSTAAGAIVPEKAKYNVLIERLLRNKEFRQMFLERLSYHMKNTFAPANTTAYFDKFIERIRPEMKQNSARWPKLSYEKWEKNLEEFRKRLEERPKFMLNDLRSYLSVTEEENKKYFSDLNL